MFFLLVNHRNLWTFFYLMFHVRTIGLLLAKTKRILHVSFSFFFTIDISNCLMKLVYFSFLFVNFFRQNIRQFLFTILFACCYRQIKWHVLYLFLLNTILVTFFFFSCCCVVCLSFYTVTFFVINGIETSQNKWMKRNKNSIENSNKKQMFILTNGIYFFFRWVFAFAFHLKFCP